MARVGSPRGPWAFAASLSGVVLVGAFSAPAAASPPEHATVIDLVADRDDDDHDGVADGDQARVSGRAAVDSRRLDDSVAGAVLCAEEGGEHARVLAGDAPIAWGSRVPRGARIQGVTAGTVRIRVDRPTGSTYLSVRVSSLGFRDGSGRDVDLTGSHASLDRTGPVPLVADRASRFDAPDPLRLLVRTADAPPSVTVESVDESGELLDSLPAVETSEVPCLTGAPPLRCFASDPLRFVIDDVDRRHPLASGRSLRAVIGGAIVLRRDGLKAQAIRVLGPRQSPVGPIERLRATVRVSVVRVGDGGPPSVGADDRGAVRVMRAELEAASATWSQCGVSFGPPVEAVVRVVSTPPPFLLSFGDGLGLPASGGRVRLKVDRARVLEVPTVAGDSPRDAATRAARALETLGLVARVSPNARVASAATPSVDVLVTHRDGTLARLDPAVDPSVSDDATMSVRIGAVDLADGLAHFGDADSVAGTLEERTLLKALDDGDPSTLEVVVVPSFTDGGRIGESFIGTDRSSLRNVVVVDRSGIRARRSSMTLAHELGHVLLDVAGHPDDFGADTPTQLMDADAADASPFGPRRLTLDECARVMRSAGPGARVPLLRPWPLRPLDFGAMTSRGPFTPR